MERLGVAGEALVAGGGAVCAVGEVRAVREWTWNREHWWIGGSRCIKGDVEDLNTARFHALRWVWEAHAELHGEPPCPVPGLATFRRPSSGVPDLEKFTSAKTPPGSAAVGSLSPCRVEPVPAGQELIPCEGGGQGSGDKPGGPFGDCLEGVGGVPDFQGIRDWAVVGDIFLLKIPLTLDKLLNVKAHLNLVTIHHSSIAYRKLIRIQYYWDLGVEGVIVTAGVFEHWVSSSRSLDLWVLTGS